MVSTSEGLMYYCTVFLTALVFLTEASAIATNYDKCTTQQNKTHEPYDVSPQRTKLIPTRSRSSISSKNQNHEHVSPFVRTKLMSNAKIESTTNKSEVSEILLVSNSGGENDIKEKGGGANTDDDDEQKTLAQQVAEGKYGLIQDEIFTTKPISQGIISYDVNPEVPKDNINSLGGLEEEDIWLAENHLLVLTGGSLGGMQGQWAPLDNYAAPKRPVQIPLNPKVPPPFPVQLSEDGPIEYISSGQRTTTAPPLRFSNPLLIQYPRFNKSQNYVPSLYGKVPYGSIGNALTKQPQLKPQLPPVLVKPPPGAEFIPSYIGATNQSDAIDEDDPSLYYPPPYDFYYPQDKTSRVPPGPLVPGIVLPPPPNFFTWLGDTAKPKERPNTGLVKDKQYNKYGKQFQYPDINMSLPRPLSTPTTTAQPPDPSTFIPYNLFNVGDKLTYPPHINKVNDVNVEDINQGWIPIPAPQPYYITGPLKPVKDTVLVIKDSPVPHNYAYDRLPNIFNQLPKKKPSLKFLHYIDQQNTTFPSTTPLTSQIVRTQLPVHSGTYSTTPISPSYDPSAAIKATYYFYEEPKFLDVDQPKPVFSTTTLPPPELQTHHTRLEPGIGDPITNKKQKPITPMIPIYYLAGLENIADLIKPANLPYTQAPRTEYYTTTAKPTYAINKPSSAYNRPTPKPILEYSYIASDYNTPVIPATNPTLQPAAPMQHYNTAPHYNIDYNTYYQQVPQYPMQQHYSILSSILNQYANKPIQTTAAPIMYPSNVNSYLTLNTPPTYHFDQPWIHVNLYSPPLYHTETPYYSFTKEDEDLIDDNTKKYFTLFGQKIKHGVEATTPLPDSETLPASTTSSSLWNTKYIYPNTPSQLATNPHSSTVLPSYQASSTNRPISLESDTKVNYVTPLPVVNPEAEYVTSALAKHIRPIVVEDLPSDVHIRLKNLMNNDNTRQRLNNPPSNKFRYTLVDAKYNSSLPYIPKLINTYRNHYQNYESLNIQPSSTPVSLTGNIQVNYNNQHLQKLEQNPNDGHVKSDYGGSKGPRDKYEEHELHTPKPISLQNDILVNYKRQYRPTPNPDAEYIDTSNKEYNRPMSPETSNSNSNHHNHPHNVVSYKYPGIQSGHYYFLTPQQKHSS